METTYLGVTLTDDLSCAKDVERAKLAHKAIKRICGINSDDSSHECLEQVNLPILKHFLAKKLIQYTFRLFQSRSLS